jgi:predicted nucleic acid-binding protein
MGYVYDTSFAGAVIIPDERNKTTDKIHSKIIYEDADIFVPQLFWYELTSVFFKLILSRRYTNNEVISFYPYLDAIRLVTDTESGIDFSQKLFHLSSTLGLSSYDAAYLELADRKRAVLCTMDNNLKTVAEKYGVKVL